LHEVTRRDVQRLVDDLRARGLQPSTVHNKLDPLRVLFRRAIRDELVQVDPILHLELPRVRGRRERIASPEQAEALIDALPIEDRALWATAFYGGLRRGELRALRWRHVDFDSGVLRVSEHWDDREGAQAPKTEAGRRVVPIAARLRAELVRHKLATGRGDDDLVFGRTAREPFIPTTIRSRSMRAWGWKERVDPTTKPAKTWIKARPDALDPIALHEARHTCASYFIAAEFTLKQLTVYIGHSDVRTTINTYGHLLPGDEAGAAAKLDALLARSGS
jgi:integrase